MPNITGGMHAVTGTGELPDYTTGAFTYSRLNSANNYSSGNMSITKYDFNAGGSNAIYGASTTVQPPAISLIPQIKF